MDDIVKAALAKWPSVPHCYGWLALDARGDWYLRDAAAQAAGPFPRIKGSRIEHARLLEFIARNYEADARGCWFFQNGPQRVYAELEAAPFVWRIDRDGERWRLSTAAGRESRFLRAWLDEQGRVFAEGDAGFGLVHSLDTELAAQALEQGDWQARTLPFAEMTQRFAYVLRPQPPAALT